MIALVEGASRQRTPNEIALNILLASLTIVFLAATATLQPFAAFAGAEQPIVVLVALLVCLIPTTIGALLSAIGIAGMDRLVQHNVLAMSGRAVEAAGDVNTLLLDKTGTVTLGNRQAAEFIPVEGCGSQLLADAAQLSSLADADTRGPLDRGGSWPTRCQANSVRASSIASAVAFSDLRRAIAAESGVEVKNLGDGLMVVFMSPAAALRCAVVMQQGVDGSRGGRVHGMQIRVGIAVGETVVDEGDYFGDAVVEAAGLCALAAGRQILATTSCGRSQAATEAPNSVDSPRPWTPSPNIADQRDERSRGCPSTCCKSTTHLTE